MDIPIYDNTGHGVAYIAEDGETIYTWNGHARAYLNDGNLFSWNGKHIGWFMDGVIFDRNGDSVGYLRESYNGTTFALTAKSAKYAPSVKSARSAPFARPSLSRNRSNKKLLDLLTEAH